MTTVCLLGADDVALRQTLLGHETARQALSTYDLAQPYHNAIALETVSLGAAVALLNDLEWYLVRYVATALVRDPSVSETEWLSRELATAIRDGEVDPAASGRYLMVYGVEPPADGAGESAETDGATPSEAASDDGDATTDDGNAPTDDTRGTDSHDRPRLVEPMYVTRTDGAVPAYDLRDVDETIVVRVTEREFSG